MHHRPPGLLIKMVTTLDVLSGGRAYLGLRAGWFERESLGLGLGFPPLSARYDQLEETLRLTRKMWSDDTRPFDGVHYHLTQPICRPQPVSRPHPPILIGGEDERKTLRLVAEYADACNLWVGRERELMQGPELVRHKLEVLRQHCAAAGRDPDAIEVTVLTTQQFGPDGLTMEDFVEGCQALNGVGVDPVIVNTPEAHTLDAISALSETAFRA